MKHYIPMIESALLDYMKPAFAPHRVPDAMAYSASAGGKRIRPCLTMEFCRVCGGDPEAALPFACGIEMIQTYSLIHDDLPCMDDDDMRRGKPSCHKQFDEATALLAGDGLLTLAFGALASAKLPAERIAAAVAELSLRAGIYGMVGGQEMDLANESAVDTAHFPLEVLKATYERKTCALLAASCKLGVIAAGGTAEQLQAAEDYAVNMGLAFQIIDDILDVVADENLLGKPVGSDVDNGKPTYVTVLGLDGARAEAAKYTKAAIEALGAFADNGALTALTESLLVRNY